MKKKRVKVGCFLGNRSEDIVPCRRSGPKVSEKIDFFYKNSTDLSFSGRDLSKSDEFLYWIDLEVLEKRGQSFPSITIIPLAHITIIATDTADADTACVNVDTNTVCITRTPPAPASALLEPRRSIQHQPALMKMAVIVRWILLELC